MTHQSATTNRDFVRRERQQNISINCSCSISFRLQQPFATGISIQNLKITKPSKRRMFVFNPDSVLHFYNGHTKLAKIKKTVSQQSHRILIKCENVCKIQKNSVITNSAVSNTWL